MRLFSVIIFLLSFSHAAYAVKLINVTAKTTETSEQKGYSIDLQFDGSFSSKSVTPLVERNFFQFVLKNVKMDAAKVVHVPNSQIEKIFAYAYLPDITRVRIIFNHLESARLSQWVVTSSNVNAKTVRLLVKLEDDPLLKEVMYQTPEIDIQNPDSVKQALSSDISEVSALNKNTAEEKSIGIKIDPTRHFVKMAISLFVILSVFIVLALLVRRYAAKIKKLPFGKKDRLIQVVATHYLGSKKSISLVKVTGEYMVVGVSNDGISLITKLGPEIDVEKYFEDRFWGGTFEKHLNSYTKNYDGVRDLGQQDKVAAPSPEPVLKVSESIKEKLSKLKPLA